MSSHRAVFVPRQRKKNEYEDLKLEIKRLESELGVDDKYKPGNAGDTL